MTTIEHAASRNEFITDVDGYVYWWQSGANGHLAAHHLRELANELDRRNAEWDAQAQRFFGWWRR